MRYYFPWGKKFTWIISDCLYIQINQYRIDSGLNLNQNASVWIENESNLSQYPALDTVASHQWLCLDVIHEHRISNAVSSALSVFSLNLPGTPCMSWGEHWRPPLTSARGSSSGSPRPIGSSGSESVVVSETRVSLLLSDPGNTAAPAHEVHTHTHSTVRHAALPHAQRQQCNAQKLEFFAHMGAGLCRTHAPVTI